MQHDEAYGGVDNLEVMREAENYNRYLLDTVRKYAPPRGRVLDFGAGSGQFSIPLGKLGYEVTALEPDTALRDRVARQGVRTVAGPDELPDESFEFIYTLNVLEHIPEDVQALRQLHSKLKPNGTLLIYVPAFPVLYSSMDAKVGHVRRYTRRTLGDSVRAAGFSIDRLAYVDSLGFFAALAFKLIDSRQGAINRTALKAYDRLVFPISRTLDAVTSRGFGKNLLLVAHK